MNALLIHNDNLPTRLVEAFESSVKFNIGLSQMMQDGFSFDRVAHEFLESNISSKQFDAIYIPYTLSNQNFLELSGIRLVLHIRLTPEFRHTRVPIVFIGYESREQIAKLTEFPSFLFTSGIFSTNKFEYESLLKIYDWLINKWKQEDVMGELSTEEYEGFLNKINIEPPSNYLSHHSVDNELSLLRWSKYLKCDKDIPEVKMNLNTGLFFKYRKAKFPPQFSETGTSYLIEGKAKILLIDDEAQKGWEHFYRTLFKASPSIVLNSLNIDFKLSSKSNIIKEAVKQIQTCDPDIILLDLRLCDSDFDNHFIINELSGIKIMEEAKKINRGIQVIITTASNKSKVYETTLKKGADFHILKNDFDEASKSINDLYSTLKLAINRSKILKPLHTIFGKIEIHGNNFSEQFMSNLKINLSISFDLLNKSFDNEKYRNYAYLQLFLIVEEFIKEDSVFEFGSNCYVISPFLRYLVLSKIDPTKKNSPAKSAIRFIENNGHYHIEQSTYNRSVDTNFVISAILLFRNGLATSGGENWSKIYSIRNKKAAHPEVGIVEFTEIKMLSKFLEFILDESTIKPTDPNNALSELSPEEQVENLKKIWGAK